MGLVPLIDDLRIGGSDHTHKTAHYSDLTAAPSSRNSGGRLQSITGRANAMAELIARITALLRRPGGALGMTLEASNVRLDTVGRELTIGGIPVGCAEEYQPKPRIDCRGRPDVCRNPALSSINMAVCIKPAVNFETPDQIRGFSFKGHKTSPLGDAELAAVAVVEILS